MANLPTNRTVENTPAEHVSDHNILHDLVNDLDSNAIREGDARLSDARIPLAGSVGDAQVSSLSQSKINGLTAVLNDLTNQAIPAGSVSLTKLTQDVRDSLAKADTAIQSLPPEQDLSSYATTAALNAAVAPKANTTDLDAKADAAATTAALATKVNEDALVYNAKDHGVTGDGTTDDTAAMQALIDQLNAMVAGPSNQAKGAVIYCPPGVYKWNVVLKTGVKIKGAGNGTMWRPFANGPVFSGPQTALHYSGVTDGYIYGNSAPIESPSGNFTEGGFNDGIYLPMGTGSAGVSTSGTWECEFRNLRIEHCGNHGLHIEGGTIYQAHQFSIYEQIHCEYNHGNGVFAYGFVQNNAFIRLTCRQNKGSNWRDKAYLTGGTTWNTFNTNSFYRGIFEGSGKYLVGPTLTDVVGTTHGVHTEGFENDYLNCWFEANGLGEPSGAHYSSGIYFDFIPTGKAMNRVRDCHFANHFMDIYCWKGTKNQISGNKFVWNGATPSGKFAYIRVHDNLGAPDIFPNDYGSGAGDNIVYNDGGTPPTAYFQTEAGNFGIGLSSHQLVSGAKLTLEGGDLAYKTDATYDIGRASNRPRDVYASRNLQLAAKPVTMATAAPTSGTYVVGSVVFNSTPVGGGNEGWVCTVAGTPGTWAPFGKIGGAQSVTSTLSTAGGSPMTYTATQSCNIYVIGGTWTNISINGVNVATSSPGMLHLEAGDVAVFTWTAAPTALKLQVLGSGGV